MSLLSPLSAEPELDPALVGKDCAESDWFESALGTTVPFRPRPTMASSWDEEEEEEVVEEDEELPGVVAPVEPEEDPFDDFDEEDFDDDFDDDFEEELEEEYDIEPDDDGMLEPTVENDDIELDEEAD